MKIFRGLNSCALVIFTLVLVFPMLAGCSGADESDRFTRLLKLIPSEYWASSQPLLLTDLASYNKDYGISLSDPEGNPITLDEYTNIIRENEIRLMIGGSSYITGWDYHADRGTIKNQYVGYNFTNLDAEIRAGSPPYDVVAAIGRYDPRATRDALSNQDRWPSWAVDAYKAEEYDGVTVYSWGDGFETHVYDSLVPPHIDIVGRARPLAVTEDYLYYAPSVDIIKSMIDASREKEESLADLPAFAEIANKLSDLGAYTALIGIDSIVNGDPRYEGTYPGPILKKFITFGSATAKDEKGTFMVIVIYHRNPDDAEANVALLEERISTTSYVIVDTPWTDFITEMDIKAEGNLVVAKLYTEDTTLSLGWVYVKEPLLLHEG